MDIRFGNILKDHTSGNIGSGGWKIVSSNSTGLYEIDFDTPFDETPAVTATVSHNVFNAIATVSFVNRHQLKIQTYYPDLLDKEGNSLSSEERKQNAPFSFIAIARELPVQTG